MDSFNKYLQGIDLKRFREYCADQGVPTEFRKGDLLVRRGEVCTCWGYVVRGSFAYLVTDSAGTEYIVGFAFSGSIVTDFLSMVRNTPASTDIVAISDSQIMACPPAALRALLDDTNGKTSTSAAIFLFEDIYNRYISLYTSSPKERYMALMARYPDLLQLISLKQLAAYLRITPTYLSRIRKELLHKEC